MKNQIPIIIWVIIFAFVALLTLKPGKAPVPVAGCCQVAADACADGTTVTEDVCLEELKGEWIPNTTCNTDTGKCG